MRSLLNIANVRPCLGFVDPAVSSKEASEPRHCPVEETARDTGTELGQAVAVVEERDLPIDRAVVLAIRDALERDLAPIPLQLTQFAIDALQWRVVDDELASIAFDSSTDELVGIRGTATMRHSIRFEGQGISAAVNVLDTSIVASIEPAAVYTCRLEGPLVSLDIRTDEHGQLAVSENELPLRLVVELADSRFVSPWITG